MHRFSLRDARRFSAEKIAKNPLVESDKFFFDLYCLEPGQEQKAHRHDASDKIYLVLEGKADVSVGAQRAELGPNEGVFAPSGSDHGIRNSSAARAVVLVFMSPKP